MDDRCSQEYATMAALDSYTEMCAHAIIGPVCDYALGKLIFSEYMDILIIIIQ